MNRLEVSRAAFLASFSALIFLTSPATAQWRYETRLAASDAAAVAEFGSAVALDGEVLAVGAPNDPRPADHAGAAYVFRRSGSSWLQQARLAPPDAAAFDEFGSAVAISGDVLVVGSPFDDDAGRDSGSVYVFRFDGSSWAQEAKLLAVAGRSFDNFGYAVATDGQWIAVGAPFDDDRGSNSGSLVLFRYDSGAWVQFALLTASDGAAGDQLGMSLALNGGRLLAGAPRDDAPATNAGSAYLFAFDGAAWNEAAHLLPSAGAANDEFGLAVALHGDLALVGAPKDDFDREVDVGAAYVFRFDGSSWQEEARLAASDSSPNDALAHALALGDDVALLGALQDDRGTNSGSVYVFRFNGSSWQQHDQLFAPDGAAFDSFGAAIACSRQRALFAAPGDDDGGDAAGAVYLFSAGQSPACDAGGPYAAECQGPLSTLLLDGSRSSDPDGDALSYLWSSDDPALSFDDPTSPTPTLSIAASPACSQDFSVTLTVSDGQSDPVSCSAGVTLADTTPPRLSCPAEVVVFSGDSTDPADAGGASAGDCQPDVQLVYSDAEQPSECAADPVARTVTRTWTATDACGNSSSCEQTIRVMRVVVVLDILPGQCPNVRNSRSQGVLHMNLLASPGLDLAHVDHNGLRLARLDCAGKPVAPMPPEKLARQLDFGSPPADQGLCACPNESADGLADASLKFRWSDVQSALDLVVGDGATVIELVVTGVVYDKAAALSREFVAVDCLTLVPPGYRAALNHGDASLEDLPPELLPGLEACGLGAAAAVPLTMLGLLCTAGRTRAGASRTAGRRRLRV